jgi:hypothetical protein
MASHRSWILQLAGLWQVQIDRDQLWEKPPGEGIQVQIFS